jgi:hypothetical protein
LLLELECGGKVRLHHPRITPVPISTPTPRSIPPLPSQEPQTKRSHLTNPALRDAALPQENREAYKDAMVPIPHFGKEGASDGGGAPMASAAVAVIYFRV